MAEGSIGLYAEQAGNRTCTKSAQEPDRAE